MEILKEMVFGNGYCLVKTNNLEVLKNIQTRLVELVRSNKKLKNIRDINDLRSNLKLLNGNQINKIILSLLISFPELSSMLVIAFSKSVEKLAGTKIFLQRRSHVMFNVTNFKDNAVAPHIDGMSGISPFAFTLWVPVHEINDNSGIWALDQSSSMESFQMEKFDSVEMGNKFLNIEEKKMKPIPLKFGEAIIFNPFVLHGSLATENPLSRIGISCRFQSRNSPLFMRNSEFFAPYQFS